MFDICMPRTDCYNALEWAVGLKSEDLAGAELKGALWSGTCSDVRLPGIEVQHNHICFVTLNRLLELSVSQFPYL